MAFDYQVGLGSFQMLLVCLLACLLLLLLLLLVWPVDSSLSLSLSFPELLARLGLELECALTQQIHACARGECNGRAQWE